MSERFRAVSLFSGAGGMDVGFAAAGFEVVWANEMMPHAAETYRRNHSRHVMVEGDIRRVKDSLPKDVDCVFGGPPCQGFSVAGKMSPSDSRSDLVFEFMDVVERTNAKAFVMENVSALARLEKFSKIRERLSLRAEELGFSSKFFVLNASEFGVPQSRERMFFIGSKMASPDEKAFDELKTHSVSVGDVVRSLGRAGSEGNPLSCRAKITLAKNPVLRKSPYAGMLLNGGGRVLDANSISCTLPASMGGNRTPILDEEQIFSGSKGWIEGYLADIVSKRTVPASVEVPSFLRRMTLREASAIQTFPENYEFSGPASSAYAQIGNAVPCRLAEVVAKVGRSLLESRAAEGSVREIDMPSPGLSTREAPPCEEPSP